MRLGHRARARATSSASRTTSTSASCRARSSATRRSPRSSAGERVIYQGALRAETTLAGREVEIVGVPDFMLPARARLRDPRLEAQPQRRPAPPSTSASSSRPTAGSTSRPSASRRSRSRSTPATGEILDARLRGRRRRARDPRARSSRSGSPRRSRDEHVGVSKCSGCGFRSRCWPQAVERQDVGLLPWVDRGLDRRAPRAGRRHARRAARAASTPSALAELERPWGERTEAGRRARRADPRSAPARSSSGRADRARAARDPRARRPT